MNSSKVWYVTGASQGFGLSLVKKLLSTGYRVAATSRNTETLKQVVGAANADQFLPLAVDLGNINAIQHSIEETMSRFGTIDVLVNNAGYGMAGTLEETPEQDIRKIFDVNVLALLDVTKTVLPIMRQQRSGYIINMGSVAGFVGAPGWSVYSATKAAVAAFSEVLALDVKEFGIKVTVVEPSGFRTGFLTKDSLAFTESRLEGYEAVKKSQKRYLAMSGKQAGDPERAADIFISVSEDPEPPLHLYLGKDAYERSSEKLSAMTAELVKWKSTTIGVDFPM
jgi:short-subunit dehydrogenase